MMKLDKNRQKRGIYKKNIARIYALWRSIPFIFRELPGKKLTALECDIDNEMFKKLIECRTKTRFREIFKVSRGTLAEWDKSEEIQKMIDDFNRQSNVLKYKKDMDFQFTQITMKKADAARVRLWYQLYMGWRPPEK